jgi:hypothetical protein
MDGVCIKIGLIFPVALQKAIKKLETPTSQRRPEAVAACAWRRVALISRERALTRVSPGKEGRKEGKKERTAFEKFFSFLCRRPHHTSLSLSLSLSLSRITPK